MKKQVAIGIDLGTTNCCAAIAERGKIRTLSIEGSSTMPSIIAEKSDGTILVGKRARTCANPVFQHSFVKRVMGTDMTFPFKQGGLSSIQISSRFLAELKRLAVEELQSEVAAVITVPAHFEENLKADTRKAAEEAGLEVLDIIPEPVAAAIAYHSEPTSQSFPDWKKILVYDLGGGTMDATVCIRSGEHITVGGGGSSYDGNRFMGGYDFDKTLIRMVEKPLIDQGFLGEEDLQGLTANSSSSLPWIRELLRQAESIKRRLSTEEEVEWDQELTRIDDKQEDEPRVARISLWIKRTEFESSIESVLKDTLRFCDNALLKHGKAQPGRANLSAHEIIKLEAQSLDGVILVGGSSRIPAVRQKISAHFKERYNIEPRINMFKPDECVAIGAAVHADSLLSKKVACSENEFPVIQWSVPFRSNVPQEIFEQRTLSGLIDKSVPNPHQIRFTVIAAEQTDDVSDSKKGSADFGAVVPVDARGSFSLPSFALAEGHNVLHMVIEDAQGLRLAQQTERICRGGVTTNPGGLARPIFARLVDGLEELIPEGTPKGTARESTFYINSPAGSARLPLYEGYRAIGSLEFDADATPGTAVDLRTSYDSGNLQVEIKVGEKDPQLKEVTWHRQTIENNRQDFEEKFQVLLEETERLLAALPQDNETAMLLGNQQKALIADLRMEFESTIISDPARIDDRLNQLEMLKYLISMFALSRDGLQQRISLLREQILRNELIDESQLLSRLKKIEEGMPQCEDKATLTALCSDLEEISHSLRLRSTCQISEQTIASMFRMILAKIERIREVCGNDQTVLMDIKKIADSTTLVFSGLQNPPAARFNRLWQLEHLYLDPIYHNVVIRRDQEGLLRSQPQ